MKTSKKSSNARMCEWFETLKPEKLSFPQSSEKNLDEVYNIISSIKLLITRFLIYFYMFVMVKI